MALIVVAGALANKPGNGGDAWTRLSWIRGFMGLGHDVYFMEEIAPSACVDVSGDRTDIGRSVNLAYSKCVIDAFGLSSRAALFSDRTVSFGHGWTGLREVADAADLLVNISGNLMIEDLKSRFRTTAFIDIDPGYTQFWAVGGLAVDHLGGHDFYFTVGENIGQPDCPIPTGDITWRITRQPVVLEDWEVPRDVPSRWSGRFTTISSWRGPYGRVTQGGVTFGLKAHEFRKFVTLPARTGHEFEIALDIHPDDRRDRELLETHAWHLADPKQVAGDPFAFRGYVRESGAEFSVAQGIYVETRSGWFSDRTVRYLASGKPALVQDTGFSAHYPVGMGLVPFTTVDDAIRGAAAIVRDYDDHRRAARAIAEEYFDSTKVLRNLLVQVGLEH
jgi:hypothetical protein